LTRQIGPFRVDPIRDEGTVNLSNSVLSGNTAVIADGGRRCDIGAFERKAPKKTRRT
jgi:hypothetical protein